MKHIYFQVIDISKASTDVNYSYFGEAPINHDIAGYVTSMANRNKSNINDIRLFIFESKKAWNEAMREWVSKIK